MKLTGNIIPVNEMTGRRRDEMFAMMTRYYENVRRAEFESDLSGKDWVIEVAEPRSGRLCGFSTQAVFPVDAGGQTVFALFSGDTIIDAAYRQNNPLAGLWGRLALRLAERIAPHNLYWFLISKGLKTYRFLPVFFREFYPRFDAPPPPRYRNLIDAFGMRLYPDDYDATAAIIRASTNGCRLRADDAGERPRRHDPHARFFQARNPRHALGDELCCVAPLGRDNFTPAAWKVIRSVPELSPEVLAHIDAACDDRQRRAQSIPKHEVPAG